MNKITGTKPSMNAIQLGLFASRIEAVCDEMGAMLRNAAFSPNIRDRLDFSCAVFDARGELCAQAAHIPVHLGSMAFAMADVVNHLQWHPGDQVILNDPYLGGTHLPDVTLIAPVFVEHELQAFVVNRAHHADIGGDTPGSMPISSHLDEEGIVIKPVLLLNQGRKATEIWERILHSTGNPQESEGDLSAQLSANSAGVARLQEFIEEQTADKFQQGLVALNDYAARLAQSALSGIPDGEYLFIDYLDDDGQGHTDIPIKVCLRVAEGEIHADFSGTANQVAGNVNCPLSVAAAAVYYVFRCLMPAHTPACAGAFRHIHLQAQEGSLLNARYPAAVAAGNVETSTRIVDVVMGALGQAIPDQMAAASHGSMNNVALGSSASGGRWDYYETIGGGMGASPGHPGLGGIQTHMTNTLNTPIEVLEQRYPLRIQRYQIRRNSGGDGLYAGGDGLIREFQFLAPAEFTLLTERRRYAPWGMHGGGDAKMGENLLNGRQLAGKCHHHARPGDILTLKTPGGGGCGNRTKVPEDDA
jgi:N-methylhydantoinase B